MTTLEYLNAVKAKFGIESDYALAQHLGRKHPQALVIDCDVSPSNSARAKIEAFLELSGVPTATNASS